MAQDFTYPRVAGDYYVPAITHLYPELYNGKDFVVARAAPGDDPTIEDLTKDQYMDITAIEALADDLFSRDPYSGFTPPPPVPAITTLTPSSVAAMGGAVPLTVAGTGFEATCVVNQDGNPLVTTFVSDTSLTTNVDTDSLVAGTPSAITVEGAGGTSAPVNLTVT